ncbi:zinc finger, CCHC-type containing protein [Tanacetum coccineum]
MEDDELRLYDMDNKIFMKVTRQRNRLYKANLRIGTPVCLLANLKDDTWLWHARLGHLNFESLNQWLKRAPFPKKAKARSTSPLDLVYGDLCGPITPPTPSGKKYIFLLVDDYSRYMWVPSQHLTKLDDRSIKMVYLGNEQGSKAYRLFDPTTQRVCVSRDVKFKENETWDWKDYISEHTDDEPEWTDFRIGNLEVTNKHHDHETQPLEEDNEFPKIIMM